MQICIDTLSNMEKKCNANLYRHTVEPVNNKTKICIDFRRFEESAIVNMVNEKLEIWMRFVNWRHIYGIVLWTESSKHVQ